MTGTLAQTIQGEAGGSGAAGMFAVAATIANRANAGTFPGGSDPTAIVNAPQQFVGFSATPSATAQTFANAIQNGTLSNYGSLGNAVNFQSVGHATMGGNSVNIGGNVFSDNLGPASSNFVAPAYGGAGTTIAGGPADGGAGANVVGPNSDPLGSSVTQNPSGTSTTTPAQGTPIQTALQPEETSFITSTVTGIENAFGGMTSTILKSAQTAVGTLFGGLENWFVRFGLIVLGILIIVVALIVLLWDHGGEKVATQAGRIAAI
jgi:Cell Wall Hydrolase